MKKFTWLILGLILILGACGTTSEDNSEPENNTEKEAETSEVENSGEEETDTTEAIAETTNDNGDYPMPILEGWIEEEIVFETLGGGAIDVWHGEFSYEGEIDDYFAPYQAALTEMGFDVTVTQDDDGMKGLEITKIIDGAEHVGNVLFTDHWVKSSLQHFK